ncbi:protein ABHD15 [Osmerus eperlanus]|uniref:protein ABHD15 n=1 Tax=Osmerus eperlanus TaxID=29151 RepID=UPI002E14262C
MECLSSLGWDCVFSLFPSLLLLVASLVLRRPRVQRWAGLGVRAAAWGCWVALCWLLELPLPRAEEHGPEDGFGPALDHTSGASLACKPTALARFLLQHCGSLARPRLARWPRGDPHLQSLSSLLWGGLGGGYCGEGLTFTRDHLLLKDGGVLGLDWAVRVKGGERGDRREGGEGRREHHPGARALGCHTSTPPILLLVPHFWGGMTPHLRGLCAAALRQGFYAVVFHRRGTAGCPLATPRLTEFGDPADLVQAVAYVRSRHPSSVLLAVSEGSGSGLLLSYLGECGSSSHLTAAACVSPVLQAQLWMDTALPALYHQGALVHRKLQLSRYESSLRPVLNVDGALRSSSLRDFEEALFCSSSSSASTPDALPRPPSPGAKPGAGGAGLPPSVAWALGERARPARDLDAYWERNEPLRDADEVAVPVLCLCSRDDPLLLPASTLPLPLFQNNPYFLLAVTDRGGHCGFRLERGGGEEGGGGGRRERGRRGKEEEEEGGESWSHGAVLEYFRVVAEFLKVEEGKGWGPAGGGRGAAPPPRRRATMTRRPRPQTQGHASQGGRGEGEGLFTWQRSYTR